MPSPPKIGERVQLPSGLRVRIMVGADPARPWRATPLGSAWMLTRPGRSGHPEHYFAGKEPLQFDKTDAEALSRILNATPTYDDKA